MGVREHRKETTRTTRVSYKSYAPPQHSRKVDGEDAEIKARKAEAQDAPAQSSIWRKLIDKAKKFFKPAELQKEDKPAEPPGSPPDAALKKLRDLAKDKAKDFLIEAAKQVALKAGATDGQICLAEHCATTGINMHVCEMTYCGEELGLGGNMTNPVDIKRQP
jgi:hypothetical protein